MHSACRKLKSDKKLKVKKTRWFNFFFNFVECRGPHFEAWRATFGPRATGWEPLLYALHIFKLNGMSNACLQEVFQSTLVCLLTFASRAWHGFANRAALDRVDSFLKRNVKAGFYPPQSQMYEELCDALDEGLFKAVKQSWEIQSTHYTSTSAENSETWRKEQISSIPTAAKQGR